MITENKYKLVEFLNKYDTVIFDMDGVITGENNYWNSAALTVYQYINENIDPVYCMENIQKIRSEVFLEDRLIRELKNRGVNSNWDLGYVVYLLYIINDGDFDKIYECAMSFSNILDVYDEFAEKAAEKNNADFDEYKRSGKLWNEMQEVFQEWFLGDDIFFKTYGKYPSLRGKKGLLHNEKPIVSMEKLKALFYLLKENNINICTGTGRPYYEIYCPMSDWGLFDYFKPDGFINYDNVIKSEKELEKSGIKATLTKPHPFMFLKALFGEDYPDKDIIEKNFDTEKIKKALVVGDAGADILAAKAGGFDFAAVLTGVAGEKARGYFEEMKSDYILGSIEDFLYEGNEKE